MDSENNPDKKPRSLAKNLWGCFCLSLLIVVILAFVTPAAFNYSGYCFQLQRRLTDEDFFVSAIRYESSKMDIDGSIESAKDFLKNNPQCCILSRGKLYDGDGPFGHFLTRIFGVAYAFGDIQVPIALTKSTSWYAGDYYQVYPTFNACGKILEPFGTDVKKSETRFKDAK